MIFESRGFEVCRIRFARKSVGRGEWTKVTSNISNFVFWRIVYNIAGYWEPSIPGKIAAISFSTK